MADTPNYGSTRTPSSRPASTKSSRSRARSSSRTSESTPLLARGSSEYGEQPAEHSAASSLLRSIQDLPAKLESKRRPWPTIAALVSLCILVLVIMAVGFFGPEAVQEYAMQASVFEPTSLSIDSFLENGIRARVKGRYRLDASRVNKKSIRDIGKFGTWIAKEVKTDPTQVQVWLPEQGNVLLGTARVPSIEVDLRNGHTTSVDILADLIPGPVGGLRTVATDWLAGRLGQLHFVGKANVTMHTGFLTLGHHLISQSLVLDGNDIPSEPGFNITKLNVHEVDLPDGHQGMEVDVSLNVENKYPVFFNVPPLGFGILVDNCAPNDPHIMVADATTATINVEPLKDIGVNVTGVVRRLPNELTNACPDTHKSPLDTFLGDYIHGYDTTIYVKGSDSPSLDTPKWLTDLMSDVTVPLPFPGHTFDNLIKNFTLANVSFNLPDPFAAPDDPASNPRLSAIIKALVGLPDEMNFNLDVNGVRANADVFYHGKKLGRLDLHKWQHANATRIEDKSKEKSGLLVESEVKDAPLEITDQDVFSEVVQALLFGGKSVLLSIKASVDVKIETALGALTVKEIPADGVIPVKPIGSKGGFRSLSLKVGNLSILETGPGSLTLGAQVNLTNPTMYAAAIPYADIHILTNGTILGHVTARNITIHPGNNTNVPVTATWNPLALGGEEGKAVGRELLSQYISGYNTTLTLKTHNGSIPHQPALGQALEQLELELPTPRLGAHKPGSHGDDGNEDDGGPHFIQDATMHLISSSAVFSLLSPLTTTTLYITHLNATSFYQQDNVGHILYELPFAVPPGTSESPRLPVDWSLGSVGYEAVRNALGGTLRLSAQATVGVRVGEWEERVWYKGKGIGARVRL